MTTLDLEAISASVEAASRGPWPAPEYDEEERGWVVMSGGIGAEEHAVAFVSKFYSGRGQANAEFIARARNDVPDLLTVARAAVYRVGPEDCLQGECDHVEGSSTICPMVEVRFATADDAVEVDVLRSRIDDVHELMKRGITDTELRERLGALLAGWDTNR